MGYSREIASCVIFLEEGKREENCSVIVPGQGWEIIIQCAVIEPSTRNCTNAY